MKPRRDEEEGQEAAGSTIGVDNWVASAGERTARPTGLVERARIRVQALPPAARLAVLVVPAVIFPFLTGSDYVLRVGVNTLIYVLLAFGLNIVVGYAGLLDLGYVAFFGFGAYLYAILSSEQFQLHFPSIASVPLVTVASVVLGVVLGLSSWRLLGDYLAIVTLFFLEIFVTVVTNANRITPPGHRGAVDFTGGPNGIAGVDNLAFFGVRLTAVRDYYYFALLVFTLLLTGLYFLNRSRTGRAWRAIREDPLAAQLMGMPVNRLKLLAFAFGAGIAGFTGTIFAALQAGVFPGNFDVALLITLYAMVILGGAGSLGGVMLGVISLNVVLEVLRTPGNARLVFYGLLLLALLAWLRPWQRLVATLGGTLALGFAVHELVAHFWYGSLGSPEVGATGLTDAVGRWVVVLQHRDQVGNIGYAVLIVAVIALTRARGHARTLLLIPTLYLAAFVWENRLALNPSITRLILLGWLLIVLMNIRPQGLLGTDRVEIV